MEIPSVVNLEGHQSWTASGLQTLAFSTQQLTSESFALSANGSADHKGHGCLPEAQGSLLEPDEDTLMLKKSFVCVSHNNAEFVEAVYLPGEAHLDQSPLTSAQLHEAAIVFTLPRSNDNCCGNMSLPVPVTEGQSNQMVHNTVGQTVDLNCGCVKTDFERLQTTSNGHVFRPPKDLCPILNLDSSPTLTVPATVPDSGWRVLDLPCIVKHKPSSITFSHYACPSSADSHAYVNESSEDGASSPEEDDDHDHGGDGDDDDDDEEDDVFPELLQSRELLVNYRQRSTGKDKQKRRGAMSVRAEILHSVRNCGYEAEEENSRKEETPQVKSPWSESMSQLMRKLDQLNRDIEEALGANSSPSDTPCTTRKKQWGAVSKSMLNQIPNDQALHKPGRGECLSPDGFSAPCSASMGTRATTKKTMFNKTPNAAGAAGLRRPLLWHGYEVARWHSVSTITTLSTSLK